MKVGDYVLVVKHDSSLWKEAKLGKIYKVYKIIGGNFDIVYLDNFDTLSSQENIIVVPKDIGPKFKQLLMSLYR